MHLGGRAVAVLILPEKPRWDMPQLRSLYIYSRSDSQTLRVRRGAERARAIGLSVSVETHERIQTGHDTAYRTGREGKGNTTFFTHLSLKGAKRKTEILSYTIARDPGDAVTNIRC